MGRRSSRKNLDADTQKVIDRFESLHAIPTSPRERATSVLDDEIMRLHYEGKSVKEVSSVVNDVAQVITSAEIRRVIAKYIKSAELAEQLIDAGVIKSPE